MLLGVVHLTRLMSYVHRMVYVTVYHLQTSWIADAVFEILNSLEKCLSNLGFSVFLSQPSLTHSHSCFPLLGNRDTPRICSLLHILYTYQLPIPPLRILLGFGLSLYSRFSFHLAAEIYYLNFLPLTTPCIFLVLVLNSLKSLFLIIHNIDVTFVFTSYSQSDRKVLLIYPRPLYKISNFVMLEFILIMFSNYNKKMFLL